MCGGGLSGCLAGKLQYLMVCQVFREAPDTSPIL